MKTFAQYMNECNSILLLQIQYEIDSLEEQLSLCDDEELKESIASRLRSVSRRGANIARRAAIATAAAAAVAGGGAAQAADFSGNVNVSRGAVPAQATDQSVSGAVDQALANPGKAQSASSEKGRMKTTVSGGINVSGRIGGGGDKREKKEKQDKQDKQQSNRKYRSKAEVTKQRAERQKELDKKDTFKTKYRYAVPTGTGGRFGTRQASGPNQVSSFKPVGTNRTGGTNFQRTKIVGDPTGPGSTGRTVGAKKYDRLFGPGGKYAPKGDGSRTIVPSSLGRMY
tara:strand:+ start:948 stop:1799 length:852 start_codon:yes stop_codon:yes gene_type:complete